MNHIPDPEATPLRLRLGPRADGYWQPPVRDMTETEDSLPGYEDEDLHHEPIEVIEDLAIETPKPAEVTPPAAPMEPERTAAPHAWSERLDRAIANTDERVERWVADQQRRLVAGLDLMLAQLKEQRREEAARIDAWRSEERKRVEVGLTAESERFHTKLMAELTAFEEQLALRLIEQEERLAKWWDEAEKLAHQRFAEMGLAAKEDSVGRPS